MATKTWPRNKAQKSNRPRKIYLVKSRGMEASGRFEVLKDYYSNSSTIQDICNKHNISKSTLYNLKKQYDQMGTKAWPRNKKEEEEHCDRMIIDAATEFLKRKIPFNSSDILTFISVKHNKKTPKSRIFKCLKHDLNLSYK